MLQIQKTQKHGLRDALARAGLVYEYDWLAVANAHDGTYMINYLRDIIDAWKPDILVTQIHTPNSTMFDAGTVAALRREYKDLVWVNWNGDYHPEDLLSRTNIAMVQLFDLQCVVTTQVRNEYARHGVSWAYWQIGFEHSDANPDESTIAHDVVFLASGYSGARQRLGKMLRALPDVSGALRQLGQQSAGRWAEFVQFRRRSEGVQSGQVIHR